MKAASPKAFAGKLVADAGSDHRIWLVWQPGYQTFGIKCDVLASTLLAQPGLGGHNWVAPNGAKYYEPMTLTEYAPQPGDGRRARRLGPRPPAGLAVRPDRPGPTEALLPFLLARVVVLGVLGLAHFIVDRTHPAHVGVAARVHEGLLGWDAGFYETIARVGYAAMGAQSLRFFPAVPVLTHAVAWFPGVGDGAALIVVANVAAFVATALLYVLVRRETGDAEVARRAIWILSLAPAAYVLVMGYAESILLCLAIGCFLALRPGPGCSGRRPAQLRPWPRVLRLPGGALTRPIGVLLALAVAVELVRWWTRLGRRPAAGRAWRATAAPVVGLAAFGLWAAPRGRRLLGPAAGAVPVVAPRGARRPVRHRCSTTPRGLWHHHVGTALHVPWVVLALVLLVVCWRRLPASYTVFAARGPGRRRGRLQPRFVRALRPQRLPADHRGRPVCGRPQVERVVLVLLPAALAGYALLAFLNISVP